MPNDRRRLFALNQTHIAMRDFAEELVAGNALEQDFEEAKTCAVVIRRLPDATYLDISGPFDNFVEVRPLYSP